MKKNILKAVTLAVLLSFGTLNAQTIEKKSIEKTKGTKTLNRDLKKKSAASMTEGVEIVPSATALKENNVEVELRGCYGDSQSGLVYMVIAVKALKDWQHVYAKHILGVTSKGKSYKSCTSSSSSFEVIKDFPVEINMSKTSLEGVPAEVEAFAAIKTQIANNEYIFKNVPIQWDVKPE